MTKIQLNRETIKVVLLTGDGGLDMLTLSCQKLIA